MVFIGGMYETEKIAHKMCAKHDFAVSMSYWIWDDKISDYAD
jgi:hypothetical protein